MKQLLFLFLFPCIAMAQYQGNSGQKITLGEQTTADGLVYRGVANLDTVAATSKITRANKQDTSAYLLLDTVTNLLWHYKIGSNAWTQAGGGVTLFSAGTTGLTPSTATTGAVTLGGTLAVANGGTGQSTLAAAGINTGSGTLNYLPKYTATGTTFGNSSIFNNGDVGIGTASPAATLDIISSGSIQTAILARGLDVSFRLVSRQDKTTNLSGSVIGEFGVDWTTTRNSAIRFHRGGDVTGGFMTFTTNDGSERMRITAAGDVGIGTISPQSGYKLHVVDSVYVGGNVSASAYTTRSDYDLKDEIQNISYGINEVMQMQPVKYTYKSNGSTQLGFIAQDLGVITPEVVSFEDKMSVYYNALIPILTKAIQEQQALIKALEQRIINLENK